MEVTLARTNRDNIVREAAKRILASDQQDYILVDRSGSMAPRWNDTIGGVNAYIRAMARDAATADVKITVAVFDAAGAYIAGPSGPCTFYLLRRGVAAKDCKLLHAGEAQPRGGTPLYDAIGKLVNLARVDNPARSALVIVTDGEENSSKEMGRESTRAMLDECRGRGWQVIFLGADFDNFAQASIVGNLRGQTIMASSANLAETMSATASHRSSYGLTGQSINYNDEDREAALKPKTP